MRQGHAFAEQSSIGFLELTQIRISQYGSIVDFTLYLNFRIRYFGFGAHKVMIIIRKRVSWVRGHNELPLSIGVHQILCHILPYHN